MEMLMNKKIFYNILRDGIRAPSGDNMQPWSIYPKKDYSGFKIKIKDIKEDFFDAQNIASYISIGAFLKNVELSASNFNLDIKVESSSEEPLILDISFFEKNKKTKSELYEFIHKRFTSREPYSKKKLSIQFYNSTKRNEEDANLILLRGKKEKDFFGKILYQTEIIRLNSKQAHFTLRGAIKTSKEEINSKEGLDYRTLGIPIFPKISAMYLKSWKLAKINEITKINRIIAFISSKRLLESSEGIGIITSKSYSNKSSINVGKILQEFWLNLTMHNGALQPFASFPLFLARTNLNLPGFSKKQIKKIKELENKIYQNFPEILNGKKIILIFRYGITNKPKIKSLRKDVENFIKEF